jgi:hypothetical protein
VNVEDNDIGAMPPDGLGRGRRIVGLFELDVDSSNVVGSNALTSASSSTSRMRIALGIPDFASSPPYRARWPNSLG